MSNERRRGFIRASNQTDDLMEAWALPSYEAEHEDPHATAINFDPKWKPKPPPSDTSEDILPNHLTAAELDDICQSAVEEGKLEGYSQGFEKGQSEGFLKEKLLGLSRVIKKDMSKH